MIRGQFPDLEIKAPLEGRWRIVFVWRLRSPLLCIEEKPVFEKEVKDIFIESLVEGSGRYCCKPWNSCGRIGGSDIENTTRVKVVFVFSRCQVKNLNVKESRMLQKPAGSRVPVH
jgi:hypothetical protein